MPNYIDRIQPFENQEVYNIKVKNINLDLIYPIGSIYVSITDTSPAILFGGTWTQIKDKFLLASGDTYTLGSTGGNAVNSHTHTLSHTHSQVARTSGGPSNNTTGSTGLSVAQMPSHNHSGVGNHTHVISRHTTEFGGGEVSGQSIMTAPSSSSWDYNNVLTSESGGAHTHSGNGSGSGHTHAMQSHTHSVGATTTGGASPATTSDASNTNNMPPYLTVYIWERTA